MLTYQTQYLQVDTVARRLGLTKNIDIGICGDAKMAAEAISDLLAGSSPECLQTANERLGMAKQEKENWEKGKKIN